MTYPMIRRLAGLPRTNVAMHSIFVGLILCMAESAGWIGWGYEAVVVTIVPMSAWALARWWATRP